MVHRVQEFNDFRSKMNERILGVDNRAIKRFFKNSFWDSRLESFCEVFD